MMRGRAQYSVNSHTWRRKRHMCRKGTGKLRVRSSSGELVSPGLARARRAADMKPQEPETEREDPTEPRTGGEQAEIVPQEPEGEGTVSPHLISTHLTLSFIQQGEVGGEGGRGRSVTLTQKVVQKKLGKVHGAAGPFVKPYRHEWTGLAVDAITLCKCRVPSSMKRSGGFARSRRPAGTSVVMRHLCSVCAWTTLAAVVLRLWLWALGRANRRSSATAGPHRPRVSAAVKP